MEAFSLGARSSFYSVSNRGYRISAAYLPIAVCTYYLPTSLRRWVVTDTIHCVPYLVRWAASEARVKY